MPTTGRAWESKQTVNCLFCFGSKCRRCGAAAYRSQTTNALPGLHSSWIGSDIIAMQRPSTRAHREHGVIGTMVAKRVRAVFNLTEPGEHPFCGDPLRPSGFTYDPEELMAAGIMFFNFGWEDMTAPRYEFVLNLVKVMASQLTDGDAIAIHCHAGLGRTGLAIACLLVFHRHLEPQAAIDTVRAGRPGTLQTAAQTRFVHEFTRRLAAAKMVFVGSVSGALGASGGQSPGTEAKRHFGEHLEGQASTLYGDDHSTHRRVPKVISLLCASLESVPPGVLADAVLACGEWSRADAEEHAAVAAATNAGDWSRLAGARPRVGAQLLLDWLEGLKEPLIPRGAVEGGREDGARLGTSPAESVPAVSPVAAGRGGTPVLLASPQPLAAAGGVGGSEMSVAGSGGGRKRNSASEENGVGGGGGLESRAAGAVGDGSGSAIGGASSNAASGISSNATSGVGSSVASTPAPVPDGPPSDKLNMGAVVAEAPPLIVMSSPLLAASTQGSGLRSPMAQFVVPARPRTPAAANGRGPRGREGSGATLRTAGSTRAVPYADAAQRTAVVIWTCMHRCVELSPSLSRRVLARVNIALAQLPHSRPVGGSLGFIGREFVWPDADTLPPDWHTQDPVVGEETAASGGSGGGGGSADVEVLRVMERAARLVADPAIAAALRGGGGGGAASSDTVEDPAGALRGSFQSPAQTPGDARAALVEQSAVVSPFVFRPDGALRVDGSTGAVDIALAASSVAKRRSTTTARIAITPTPSTPASGGGTSSVSRMGSEEESVAGAAAGAGRGRGELSGRGWEVFEAFCRLPLEEQGAVLGALAAVHGARRPHAGAAGGGSGGAAAAGSVVVSASGGGGGPEGGSGRVPLATGGDRSGAATSGGSNGPVSNSAAFHAPAARPTTPRLASASVPPSDGTSAFSASRRSSLRNTAAGAAGGAGGATGPSAPSPRHRRSQEAGTLVSLSTTPLATRQSAAALLPPLRAAE